MILYAIVFLNGYNIYIYMYDLYIYDNIYMIIYIYIFFNSNNSTLFFQMKHIHFEPPDINMFAAQSDVR